jgi:hypothetical protein
MLGAIVTYYDVLRTGITVEVNMLRLQRLGEIGLTAGIFSDTYLDAVIVTDKLLE